MFGISHFYELVLVLVIALVIFGPKRLPELGSSLGKGIRAFRTATGELQSSITGATATALPTERHQDSVRDDTAPVVAAPPRNAQDLAQP